MIYWVFFFLFVNIERTLIGIQIGIRLRTILLSYDEIVKSHIFQIIITVVNNRSTVLKLKNCGISIRRGNVIFTTAFTVNRRARLYCGRRQRRTKRRHVRLRREIAEKFAIVRRGSVTGFRSKTGKNVRCDDGDWEDGDRSGWRLRDSHLLPRSKVTAITGVGARAVREPRGTVGGTRAGMI